MAITEISVSKIYILATEPTNKIKDRFWFDTTNNLLKRYDGTSWKPISVSSDDVVVLSSGNKVSLTNYLNTQIAALAEGIDSKQDSLHTYTETESTGAHGSKSWSTVKIFAEGGENTSGSIKLEAVPGGGGQSNITLTSDLGIITLDSGSGGEIKLEGNLTGSAISTSIPASAANTSNFKVPTTKAVKTELDKKQNKLSHYSETSSSSSTPSGIIYDTHIESDFGVYITTDNNDITLDPTGNINLNATKVQKNGVDIVTTTDLVTKQNTLQFYIESGEGPTGTSKITAYNFEVSSAQIKLNSEYGIDGNILEKTISETSSDTKIPTAKAVYTAIDAIKPIYYSEDTSSSNESAEISINKTSINVSESGGIILTAGNSADPGNIKLGLNTSSFILDSTGSLIGDTTNLLTIQSNVKNGSVSSLSGDLISKSITSSSTDTQLPTAKSVYTAVNAKANKSTTLSGYGITNAYTKTEVNTELDKKQDALNCYRETASGEAIISNATSFSVDRTSDGLIVENNNGGITIRNNSFKAGQAVISLEANAWKDDSNAFLFSVDGVGIKLSDAFLIPEIKNKQDSTDTSLETIDKTIVGAINELNNQVNTTIPEPITSVYTISSTALSSIISNTSYTGVSGQILISADVENTGPILIGEGITDKANAFPIYPDQIFPIPFSDINNFKVAGNIGNKFNYIISFRSLNNTSPAVNGGITILNENGYYKLTPSGEGETATLTITKLK